MSQQSDEPSVAEEPRRAQPDKAEVASVLDEIGMLLELDGDNPFEARAYQNAARTLNNAEGDITELVGSGALAKMPGMGKTLVARITEFVTTGRLPLYDELLAKVPIGLARCTRIPGLGPKRIRQIYESLVSAHLKTCGPPPRPAQLPRFQALARKARKTSSRV